MFIYIYNYIFIIVHAKKEENYNIKVIQLFNYRVIYNLTNY